MAASTATTMRAVLRDRYGPPEIVHVQQVAVPSPRDDEVLVRMHVASVNRADLDNLYARWAFLRLFLGIRRPRERRMGADIAGVVEAVGARVTRFRVGDRVFGDLFSSGGGAFAELARAPEKALAAIPDGMSFEDAATLPHSAILAIQGLRRRDGRTFGPGDRVLIVGASGSVGPFAVQMAKARGAHVTGVASTAKLDLVRSLGADEVIDHTTTDYTRPTEPYDWILDVNAHHPVRRWRRAIRRGGAYVALGGDSALWFFTSLVQGPALSLVHRSHLGMMLWWKPMHPADVAALTGLAAQGVIRPVIDRSYPLAEVVAALRRMDDGQARGKVLVTP